MLEILEQLKEKFEIDINQLEDLILKDGNVILSPIDNDEEVELKVKDITGESQVWLTKSDAEKIVIYLLEQLK